MTTTQRASTTTARLWRNTDYLFWLGADSGQMLGMALYTFLMPLIALIVLDEPAAAGTIAAVGQIARVLMILPGGVFSDRHDRRRLMVLAGVCGAVIAALFVLVQSVDRLDFWALLVINVAMGARNGLLGGVSNTALKSVVTTPQLPTALSANQARDGAIQLGAAPVGGVLLALGPLVALLGPLIAYLLSALSALGIRANLHPRAGVAADAGVAVIPADVSAASSPDVAVPEEVASVEVSPGLGVAEDDQATHRAKGAAATKKSVVSEAVEGLLWLWRQPPLRAVLFVSTTVNLGTNAALITLIYSFQQQGVAPAVIGLLTSALGLSVIFGALMAPWLVKRVATGRLALVAILVIATAISSVSRLESVPVIIVVFGLGFLFAPAIDAGLIGYFMVQVPQQLMGRALNAFGLFSMGAVPLAPVIAGFGLGWIGQQATLIICAACCVLSATLVIASRELRTLPGPDGWDPEQR